MTARARFAIGDVLFARVRVEGTVGAFEHVALLGDERLAALRAAYRRESIPGGLVLSVPPWLGGPGRIEWWDTAGNRVTGEAS